MAPKYSIGIQWHITTNCGHRCQHCYMFDSLTWPAEWENTLTLEELVRILDSFAEFEKKWDTEIKHLAITGGDPLLRKDWKEFLRELQLRHKYVSMMGNPETLTEENVTSLVDYGVRNFQMSLDGLEKNHDRFRSDPGTFRRTVEKLSLLKQAGIHTNIMFTLFPTNIDELIPLLRFVAEETEATSFSFDVGVFVGNAAALNCIFTPQVLKEVMTQYLDEKRRLRDEGYPLHVHEKNSLHKLIRFEQGEYYPYCAPELSDIGGCLIGCGSCSVLSDGTVLGCRRLPMLKAGKMPEQSFEEIILGSSELKKFRRREFFEGCGGCDFYQVCRGCPANVYSLTGNPLAKNPLCFRDLVRRQSHQAVNLPVNPGMNTSYAEEFDWISRGMANSLDRRFEEYLEDETLREIFVDLAYDLNERRRYLQDPELYLEQAGAGLDQEKRAFLMLHFSECADDKEIPDEDKDSMAEAMFVRMLRGLSTLDHE
jgi:radical SAM protein with 4Fe4S-binding SPASM domain